MEQKNPYSVPADTGREQRETPGTPAAFSFYQLTGLAFPEDEAFAHMSFISQSRASMEKALGRDVGLAVAAADYCINRLGLFTSPRIIEEERYHELSRQSLTDAKTGCYNARYLEDQAVREISRAARHNQELSLILVDMDHFKKLNDTRGHLFGDEVLRAVSETLLATARSEDWVARFGGDEFAVILPQTGREGAWRLACRCRDKLSEILALKSLENSTDISFSAGVATFPHDACDWQGLFHAADTALYNGKAEGRNRVAVYSHGLDFSFESPEKRRALRYRPEAESVVSVNGQEDHFRLEGRIVDISRHGALLECRTILDDSFLNKKVALALGLRRTEHSMSLSGRVVRASPGRETRFTLGVEFSEELHPEAWDSLHQSASLVPMAC